MHASYCPFSGSVEAASDTAAAGHCDGEVDKSFIAIEDNRSFAIFISSSRPPTVDGVVTGHKLIATMPLQPVAAAHNTLRSVFDMNFDRISGEVLFGFSFGHLSALHSCDLCFLGLDT